MAIYKEDIVDIELSNGKIHRSFLNYSIGSGDNLADWIGVRVFRNGDAVSLTGSTVQGVFLPPQGDPIAITGSSYTSVSENIALVKLPQACYNYDGQFTLAIKLVSASEGITGTMRIVDGTVNNTHTVGTVAPTETVPTYQEIIAIYDTMSETVEDYEEMVDEQNARIDELSATVWNHINSLDAFGNGSISFSANAPAWVENNDAKWLALYDVNHIRIASTSAKFYVKKVSFDTGVIGETTTVNRGDTYESDDKAHYYIVYDATTGILFDIVYTTFNNPFKAKYKKLVDDLSNGGLFTINNITNDDYAAFKTAVRCMTKQIYSNRIHVKCNSGYQAVAYVFDGSDITIAHNYDFEYWSYEEDAEYFLVAVKRYDGANITEEEAWNNIRINVSNLKDEPEVVYFENDILINGTSYVDQGILVLPANYDPDGDPIRLCIVCHGAGASFYDPRYTTMDDTGKILGDPQRVLTKKGYAVMDCYAAPRDYVGETASSAGMHFGNPSVITCYQKAYEYCIRNFNLKNDGVLLFGSSMGGLAISNIVHNSGIPVLCCVGYCPCLDMFKQAWCNTWATNQRYNISRLYSFEGTAPSWTNGWDNLTDAEKQYFYNNVEKVIGYYPNLYNTTTGDFDAIKSYMPDEKYGTDADEKAVYDDFRTLYEVPLMILHCLNDSTMAARYSEYFIGALKRNGQLAEIKLFQTGGHAAWAAGSDVTTTDIFGESFTCKESQLDGYNFAMRFNR